MHTRCIQPQTRISITWTTVSGMPSLLPKSLGPINCCWMRLTPEGKPPAVTCLLLARSVFCGEPRKPPFNSRPAAANDFLCRSRTDSIAPGRGCAAEGAMTAGTPLHLLPYGIAAQRLEYRQRVARIRIHGRSDESAGRIQVTVEFRACVTAPR